jgi:GNAT superfamily N-acetyltransferase
VGVGEELVNSIAAWAERQGAVAIDVAVLPGMREAKNFLEKAGFAARLLVMHRRID